MTERSLYRKFPNMNSNIIKIFCLFFGITGFVLLSINIYGLNQSLRPKPPQIQDLRFGKNDVSLQLEEYLKQIQKLDGESEARFSSRLAHVIAQGTAHIHWMDYDVERFNQRVPVWENWILFGMGIISNIPEYQRYHFSNPYKSIERGIGVCGEVSMVMEQLLEQNDIRSEIISFAGHVIVSATVDDSEVLLDPDFGVTIPFPIERLAENIDVVKEIYLDAGYTEQDAAFFDKAYTGSYSVWEGPHHFITKKYYFENVSYVLKWLIPIVLLITSYWMYSRLKRSKNGFFK